MEQINRLLSWVLANDPDLDADQRINRWTGLAALASLLVSGFGWVLSLPWQGILLIGLVAWVALLNTVLVRSKSEVHTAEISASQRVDQAETKVRELEEERDSLKAENERYTARGIQRAKQSCEDLSPKLFSFTRDREGEAPPEVTLDVSEGFWGGIMASASDPRNVERTSYDDETRRLYIERFGSEVSATLEELQHHGWLDSEDQRKLEGEVRNPLSSPTQSIRQIALRLGAVGKRL